jgi:hypothetical protein
MKEIELPTLEEKIKQIAGQKLDNDIANLHMIIYGEQDKPDPWFKLLNNVNIKVERSDGVHINVNLSAIFDNAVIKEAIREIRLPEYIEREIELVINGNRNAKL